MKNSYKILIGTVLLLSAAAHGAARHAGPGSGEEITTVKTLRTDSLVRAGRTMRIYQKLDMPYGRTLRKTAATGNASTYYEQDIDKYPTNDFRNSLTGVVAGLTVRELAGVPGMYYGGETARTALYVRGFSPAYIVDGMPAYITQLQLDPEEIESVTLVRDVADKALFGSRAANGVLHITTRRVATRYVCGSSKAASASWTVFPNGSTASNTPGSTTRRASTAATRPSTPTRRSQASPARTPMTCNTPMSITAA